MFARRPSPRFNRGRVPSGSRSFDYRSFVTSKTCLLAVQADRGVITSGGTVSQWNDMTSGGKNFTQGTGAAQPSFLASTLAGYPAIQFPLSTWMSNTFTRGTAGANPTWILSIYRIDTWHAAGANDVIYTDTAGAGATLIGDAVTPNMRHQCSTATNVNGGAAVGSWVRAEAFFNNAATDYLKQGTSKIVTGVAAGNNACFTTNMKLGFSTAGRTLLHTAFMHIIFNGEPTAGEKAAIDAAITTQFGGLVAV
jgi:hypothetical protein